MTTQFEASQLQIQFDEIQRVMADYEKQYEMTSAEFFSKYNAGQTDDRMDYVEWASLFQMAESMRKRLGLSNQESK